jgi:hypothetical protein
MHPLDDEEIDWSGVRPYRSPIAPLDSVTFLERLRLLSDRADSVTILRKAFQQQNPHDNEVSRYPEPPARQPR